jgi:AraC-like DNA-binding protein
MKQFGIFIQIMELLINRDEIHYINSPTNHINLSNSLNWRASKILSYLQQNFKNDISLTEAADITGMQVHAFCRFFKNLTSLTYSDFIIELRISYTCQLLKDSNLTITQIAFDAGFNNISYFNRTFKKSKGISPRDYRKMLLELPNL